MQVLAERHRPVPSPVQRCIYRLRSLLLVAKLASLLCDGRAPEVAQQDSFFYLLTPDQDQESGGKSEDRRNKEELEEIVRLEIMKVQVLVPLVRHDVRNLEQALALGGKESQVAISLESAAHAIGQLSLSFSVEWCHDKRALAQELYQTGRLLFETTSMGDCQGQVDLFCPLSCHALCYCGF